MALVIDASVAMGWFTSSQATSLTDAALDVVERESGIVPAHFGIEMARAFRNRERRGLMSPEIVDACIADLQGMPLREDMASTIEMTARIIALAREQTLRVADAAYLELALRSNVPLATQDQALAAAALVAGATLYA